MQKQTKDEKNQVLDTYEERLNKFKSELKANPDKEPSVRPPLLAIRIINEQNVPIAYTIEPRDPLDRLVIVGWNEKEGVMGFKFNEILRIDLDNMHEFIPPDDEKWARREAFTAAKYQEGGIRWTKGKYW